MKVLDPMLVTALWMVEHGAPATSLTISLNGIVVSGLLCSRSEWEVENEAFMDRHPVVSGDREVMPDFYDKTREIEAEHGIANQFLHLKDATIIGAFVVKLTSPWRCRLSSVDGFNFGKIGIQ